MTAPSPFYNATANVPIYSQTTGQLNTTNPFVSITPPYYVAPTKKSKRSGKYVMSTNTDYSEPIVSIHEDFYNDEDLADELTKYYYYKILDKWFYSEYGKLFGYFTITKDKVKLISSLDAYSRKDLSRKDKAKIIEYIERKKIIKKKNVKKMIQKFIDKKNINWIDLDKKIEPKLVEFLKRKLKELIISHID